MPTEQKKLEASLAALEAQRHLLGDAVVDAALGAMRDRLHALQSIAPHTTQSLRQVSILFLDVVGSTTLAQRLDPEEVSAVMDGASRAVRPSLKSTAAARSSTPATTSLPPSVQMKRRKTMQNGPCAAASPYSRSAKPSAPKCSVLTAIAAAISAWAFTPAPCCSAAALTTTQASAARPSTLPPV
jgi:class 3 adenylate cyclase